MQLFSYFNLYIVFPPLCLTMPLVLGYIVTFSDKLLIEVVLSFYEMLHHTRLFSSSPALRFGDISLQERINQRNFEMLEAYYKSLSEKVPRECK